MEMHCDLEEKEEPGGTVNSLSTNISQADDGSEAWQLKYWTYTYTCLSVLLRKIERRLPLES